MAKSGKWIPSLSLLRAKGGNLRAEPVMAVGGCSFLTFQPRPRLPLRIAIFWPEKE
jgi:hypothetical protein